LIISLVVVLNVLNTEISKLYRMGDQLGQALTQQKVQYDECLQEYDDLEADCDALENECENVYYECRSVLQQQGETQKLQSLLQAIGKA